LDFSLWWNAGLRLGFGLGAACGRPERASAPLATPSSFIF
jgi:hypothetical protein